MSYSVAADMDLFFGSLNITAWANINKDDNSTTITNRKAEAIAVADDMIDDVLRTTPYSYALPLSTVPPRIRDLSRKIAGLWLFESTGAYDIDNEGKPVHRFVFVRRDADQTLADIRDGKIKISAGI